MSFFKKLFGFGGAASTADAPAPSQEHDGFAISATPYEANGRWQLCGVISKEVEGEMREHRFVRADTFATKTDAEDMTFFKARQMIDQMGDNVLKAG